MPEDIGSSHGVNRTLLLMGLFFGAITGATYLIHPAFIRSTNNRTLDVLMNLAPTKPASDAIVIIDIDDESLARYGQWPWPRSRLAQLLRGINASGAASIGLDLILAEPDRTSPGVPPSDLYRESSPRLDSSGAPTPLSVHDKMLADTLALGPFVLGYQFLFGDDPKPQTPCGLHPPIVAWINRSEAARDQPRFFTARGVVCNRPPFSEAVALSGFLNATPDADGILRRVPMLIRFEDHLYPSLALATLMQYGKGKQIKVTRREISGSLDLEVGERSLQIDSQGNMMVRFSRADATPRISAADLLAGKLPPEKLRRKIVLVGSSAAGLMPAYQTSAGLVDTHAEIHARVLDNLLTGQRVIRTGKFLLWEVLAGLLVAAGTGLTVARMKILPGAAVCATLLAGSWLAMGLIFQARGYLLSPLFPTALVVLNYVVLTIFKTWKIQLVARQVAHGTLILLKSNEEFMNSIFEAVPDIIFRLDPEGRITFISPAIAKYTDAPDALLGRPMLHLIEPRYRDGFVKLTDDVFQGVPGNLEFEAELRGRHVWLDTHVVPFRNDAAEIVSLLGIARDITDRKLAEQALAEKQLLLQELNMHLEQRVADAVSDSRKKDQILIQQSRQAAMGEMIGHIAHQWRQPLNTLGLIVQELQMTYGRSEFNKESLEASVKKAMGVISHMSRTIEDFRNYFKPDKEKTPFNVSQAIAGTLSLVEPSLENLDIAIELLTKDDAEINGYPHEYSQVLLNIILNCKDAFEGRRLDRQRVITITVFKENGRSVVTIADNAGGIPGDIVGKVFDPYFTTKGPDKGTGIGLYMAKAIIEKNMEGRLSVRNTADGAEFRIEV